MVGLGGGEIIIPILLYFYKFDTKEAFYISSFIIFIGSLTRTLLNVKNKNPNGLYVSIDYRISIIMIPNVILGTIVGFYLNVILPSLILELIFIIMVLFLSI
jgi:uncharacterized membrane protein YfcA